MGHIMVFFGMDVPILDWVLRPIFTVATIWNTRETVDINVNHIWLIYFFQWKVDPFGAKLTVCFESKIQAENSNVFQGKGIESNQKLQILYYWCTKNSNFFDCA